MKSLESFIPVWEVLRRPPTWAYPLGVAAVVLLLPLFGASYGLTRYVELTLILALVVSGLNLALGYSGQLAIGQAAMYAAGAYTAALISIHVTSDLLVQIACAGLAALVVGIITGIPGLRLGSWSLAMTSFFLVLLLPDVVTIFAEYTGGRRGLSGINLPTISGHLLTPTEYYMAVVVVAVVWFAVMRNIVTSRHGIAFQTLKQSPVLASSVGMSVYRLKLIGYALGAIPAGLAGALFANLDGFVSLEAFNFHVVTGILAASILGGRLSVYGAVLGAAVIQYGNSRSGDFQEWAVVFFGLFLLIGGVAFRGGIVGVFSGWMARLDRRAKIHDPLPDVSADHAGSVLDGLGGKSLNVANVSKAFGGNQAVADASLQVSPGTVTALIGPNGSGKTTLLNLIGGYYRRDGGTISIDDRELANVSPDRVARAGVARTFQTPFVPPGLSVREVVASGRYVRHRATYLGAVLRTPAFRRIRRGDAEVTDRLLALVGLAAEANAEAASLPLGKRRMLEVARALASEPDVLLLDEAASGLDEGEVERLAQIVRQIRSAGCAVILVEHNFDLVVSLSDQIVVLARGSVLATGTPHQIATDPRVRREYLGIVEDENPDSRAENEEARL